MSFDFPPMTDEELDALAKDGEYDFEVMKSEAKISAKGNPMAVLSIRIYDQKGCPFTITDFLVFSQVPLNIRKVKHFCDTTGHLESYAKGSLSSDLVGWSGRCLVGTQEEMPKEGGGFHPRKNIIVDYLKQSAKTTKAPPKAAEPAADFPDDDIPF